MVPCMFLAPFRPTWRSSRGRRSCTFDFCVTPRETTWKVTPDDSVVVMLAAVALSAATAATNMSGKRLLLLGNVMRC